jgi:hypothetical protein
MALVKPGDVKRVEVHDGWIDIKAALSIGAVLGMVNGGALSDLQNPTPDVIKGMLRASIVAWSYDDPVTPENVEMLDMDAVTAVFEAVNELLDGGDSKKGSSSSASSSLDDGPTS